MFRFLRARSAVPLLGGLLLLTSAPVSAEAPKTIFCLTDGSKVGAERFEQREGAFFLYVPGASEPLRYENSRVCGVNVEPCNCGPRGGGNGKGPAHFGVQGSNTIGERLMPMLIDAYARHAYGDEPVTRIVKPEESEITIRSGSDPNAVIDFKAHGSGTAVDGLVSDQALIGMMSRKVKDEEQIKLKQRFPDMDPTAAENEHVLALDGLAVIVNPENSVTSLTLAQIAQIFSGAVTNWAAFGGPDRPITLYRRDDKSGTFDTFKSLVLEPNHASMSATAQKFESSELLSDAVAKDPGGIGFVALPYVTASNVALKIASNCGLISSPSRFSIKSEEYPLARRLYLYTHGSPSEPVARDLLNFTMSDEAQSVVSDASFINLAVALQDPADQRAFAASVVDKPKAGVGEGKELPLAAMRFFKDSMEKMRRASMEFRFKFGSSELDTRAVRDVDRLARYLRASNTNARNVYLIGFADSVGSWAGNEALGQQRAQSVANRLRDAGVAVPRSNVRSLSYLAPVACNPTAASDVKDPGLAKNRRVEVWIESR
jgi:phosphate transport system substrate-binding protein